MLNLVSLIFAALGSLVVCSELELNENSLSGILAGHLVIGNVLKLVPKNDDDKRLDEVTSNAEEYQSDQTSTDWHKKAVSKLQSLNPSVQCGDESMVLRVQGSRLPNILIDRGEDDPLPLWQVPADCGVSVKRARRDVLVVTRYQGCHVVQQGESYVLPLRLWGAPVSMSCPVASRALPVVSCLSSGMVIRMSNVSTDALKLKVNGEWLPLVSASNTCGFTTAVTTDVEISAPYQSSCWQIMGDERLLSILHEERELTLSCNTVLQEPHVAYSYYPHVHAVHHGHHHGWDTPITTTTATTSPPARDPTAAPTPVSVPFGDPKQPASPHPWMYHPHFHRPYRYPWVLPIPTTASTIPTTASTIPTTASTIPTTAAPTAFPSSQMQYPFPQMYYPYGPMFHHHRPMHHIYPWAIPYMATTTVPTTTSTTAPPAAPPASPPKQPGYPYPQLYYPFGPMYHFHKPMKQGYPWVLPAAPSTDVPTTASSITTPTTTTATTSPPARDPQHPVYPFPQMHYPFGYWPDRHRHKYYGYPWLFQTKPTTPAPTTPAPTTPAPTTPAPTTVHASDPQQPVHPFPQMHYPFGYWPDRHRHKHYGYPWLFPTKPATPTPTTCKDGVPQQPVHPFPQMHYPFWPLV